MVILNPLQKIYQSYYEPHHIKTIFPQNGSDIIRLCLEVLQIFYFYSIFLCTKAYHHVKCNIDSLTYKLMFHCFLSSSLASQKTLFPD